MATRRPHNRGRQDGGGRCRAATRRKGSRAGRIRAPDDVEPPVIWIADGSQQTPRFGPGCPRRLPPQRIASALGVALRPTAAGWRPRWPLSPASPQAADRQKGQADGPLPPIVANLSAGVGREERDVPDPQRRARRLAPPHQVPRTRPSLGRRRRRRRAGPGDDELGAEADGELACLDQHQPPSDRSGREGQHRPRLQRDADQMDTAGPGRATLGTAARARRPLTSIAVPPPWRAYPPGRRGRSDRARPAGRPA